MQRLTRAVNLSDYSDQQRLTVDSASIPLLKPNQLLVRMEYANVSTRDLTFLQGKCPVVRALPAVPGLEGSGTVVESGNRLKTWRFQGKRVGLFSLESGLPGTWAEYVVIPSKYCFPLLDSVSFEQAASMFTCPLTVYMFEEQLGKAKAIIQTGGASSITKATLRMCNFRGLTCVCVIEDVRDAAALVDIGAKYILISTDPDFSDKAASFCQEFDIHIGLDTSGGKVAGEILNAMGPGGVLYVYESDLNTEEITHINPKSLIFDHKRIKGLNLFPWFQHKKSLQKWNIMRHIQQFYFVYKPDILQTFDMSGVMQALDVVRAVNGRGQVTLHLRALPTTRISVVPTGEEVKKQGRPVGPVAISAEDVGEDEEDRDICIPELPDARLAGSLSAGLDEGGEDGQESPRLDIVQYTS